MKLITAFCLTFAVVSAGGNQEFILYKY